MVCRMSHCRSVINASELGVVAARNIQLHRLSIRVENGDWLMAHLQGLFEEVPDTRPAQSWSEVVWINSEMEM